MTSDEQADSAQLEFDFDLDEVPRDELNTEEPIDETAAEYVHVNDDTPGVPPPPDLEDQNPGHTDDRTTEEIAQDDPEEHLEEQ